MDWIQKKANASVDPERVRLALTALRDAWPPDAPPLPKIFGGFPTGEKSLLTLLAASPVSAEKLASDPHALRWLAKPEVCASERGPRRMRAHLAGEQPTLAAVPAAAASATQSATAIANAATAFDPHFRALRRVKSREMLRIALRDVARLSSLEQTTQELTWLAELCLHEVYTGWQAELARRWGRPATDFVVLGMGKFGGQELNYSSDIDVIFLYGAEGALNPNFSHQEFFTRVAEKITATFSSSHPAGPLFRIDLRLRPEGASGAIVRSLEAMENYYAGFGETWERMALIKARGVCGSEELAYEFAQRLQPFIYPRTLSHDLLEEIRAIKARIEREIVGPEEMHRNVKLGYGGIREIEFITQTLQLLHGARNAFLQERSTLKALRALAELALLERRDLEALSAAYRFLRDVEHRLQIEREQQLHTLPAQAAARTRLAVSLGYASLGAFDETYREHTRAVRAIFEKILHGSREEMSLPLRDLSFFKAPAQAEKNLAGLGAGGPAAHVAPRVRKLFGKLEPLLLEELRGVAEPDVALNRLLRFVERYGIRGLLFETLVTNPRLLELLVKLFDASRFLADIALRRPQLIEEIARTGSPGRKLGVEDFLAGLARNEEKLGWMDWVRVYRRSQLLRIGLRDILAFSTLAELQAEYSALAEACLLFVQRELGLSDSLTVIAMGKFGGGELSYGCDLDVIFAGAEAAGDAAGAAAALMRAMSTTTSEGIVFPVDARLRPEGSSGLLALPLAGYEAYFKNRAQFWEAQALTKARPVSGPEQPDFAAWARETWRRFGARSDLFEKVRAMHARIVRERGVGSRGRGSAGDALEFKTGAGGLMALEFLVQAHQMRHDVWEPNTVRALSSLGQKNILPADVAEELTRHYLFLRRCEAVIRRVENSSLSSLPRSEEELTSVAKRMNFSSLADFSAAHQAARAGIRAAFERFTS